MNCGIIKSTAHFSDGTTLPVKAWTGGRYNLADVADKRFRPLADALFAQSVRLWENYWGNKADEDLRRVFLNRAYADAFATLKLN